MGAGVGGECGGSQEDSTEGEDLGEGFGAGLLAEAQLLRLEWEAKGAIYSRTRPFPSL